MCVTRLLKLGFFCIPIAYCEFKTALKCAATVSIQLLNAKLNAELSSFAMEHALGQFSRGKHKSGQTPRTVPAHVLHAGP
jgi:hypothetical protein